MPSMTTSNGMFLLEHTINAVGDKNIQLNTENTFVDQDILVKITTPAASGLSLDIEDKTTNVTVGTLNTTTNKYPVTATVAGTLTASSAGWFSSGSGYEDNVQVGLIPKAGFTVSEGVFSCNSPGYITSGDLSAITTVTPTASINTGTNNNYNGLTTYFTKLNNSTGANVTIIPQYSTSAGYVASATNSATATNTTYWEIITTSININANTTVSGTTATRATATWETGWVTSGSIPAATFNNTATSGKTYVNISETSAVPYLIKDSNNKFFLYINRGFVDDLKIDLGKLIPDDYSSSEYGFAAANYILQGYVAFNDAGQRITGTIPTRTNTDLTFNGETRTFTALAGYYTTNATKVIDACTISAGAGAVALTADTATLSLYKSDSNTSGITISDSAPAANSGKVYIKVTGSGTVSYTQGWVKTASSTTSNGKPRYVALNKYTGNYTIT